MNGWLIVNAYLKRQKFRELFEMFLEASKDLDIELNMVSNEEAWLYFAKGKPGEKPDFILFWD